MDKYNIKSDKEKVAESWELSVHPDGTSKLMDGTNFIDYINNHTKEAWGTHCAKYDKFPILIKFIDASQALSIQVHPDDEYALKHEHEYGKNEFWYVCEAEEDAYLYYGFSKKLNKEEYKAHIQDGTLCDYLNKVKVQQGDCFYIPAGTVHAIGKGVVIAEIQQSSNSTYRIFDYNRKDKDGKLRELHIDKAVDVSNLEVVDIKANYKKEKEYHEGYNKSVLTDNPYFRCEKYEVKTKKEEQINIDSFQDILVIEGKGCIKSDDKEIKIQKGDSIYIPAQKGSYFVEGEVTYILTMIN